MSRLHISALVLPALLAGPLPAFATDYNIPLLNPGAESGGTTGWINSQNYFSAVCNGNAYQQSCHFETSFVFQGTNWAGALKQTVSVAQFTGNIADIRITLAVAQEPGAAFDPQTNTAYDYVATSAVYFLDAQGQLLSSGHVLIQHASPTWACGTFGFSHLSFINQVASVRIEAFGGWRHIQSGTVGHIVNPSWITDVPAWTRYDAFAINLVPLTPRSECVLTASCLTGPPLVLSAGTNDVFCAPFEPATAGPELASTNLCVNSLNFDEIVGNRALCHTISGIPPDIVAAILRIRMRAGFDIPCNDSIALQVTPAGTFLWSRRLGTGGPVGDCPTAAPGLLAAPWVLDATHTFCLDLAALPNADGTCTSIIPALRATGRLDIRVQDDTAVDFAELLVAACACTRPPSDMVAWWTFDAAPGGLALDNAAANSGQIVSATLAPCGGRVHGALIFDGADDYVIVPDDPSLNFGAGPFSMDAWFLARPPETGGLVKKQDDVSFVGFRLDLFGGVPTFSMSDGFQSCGFNAGVSLIPGRWHHVAVTVSNVGTGGLRTGHMYVNGQLFAGPVSMSCQSVSNTVPLYIGRGLPPNPDGYFEGLIDEVEIFNRALTPAEVQAIYAAGEAGKCKCTCPGDVNGDGVADGQDIAGFIRCLFGTPINGDHCPCGDMNGDGLIDLIDQPLFVNWLLQNNTPC